GMAEGRHFKAVQTGGPSGGCLPEKFLDMPVDYENLARAGSIMGSGGMIVMDDASCMVDVARFFMDFCAGESCGKCVPCRVGTYHMHGLLTKITQQRGAPADITQLEELADLLKNTSLCGLGQSAPNPVLSTLRYFAEEYQAHVERHRCPAGVCKAEAEANSEDASEPAVVEAEANGRTE
ncbi:MAG: NADH-ubiquinone oxidoreductase-F iron-sulfur binding region domain-containing protein, partial [Terriglobales bacterium]